MVIKTRAGMAGNIVLETGLRPRAQVGPPILNADLDAEADP
jgi:hypothetical protein